MKSLFNGILCASLLVFAAGCGKDNKSGNNNYYKNLFNNALTGTSQQSLQNVVNWYNSNVEGYPQQGMITIVKTQRVYNTQPNCSQKTFLGIPYQFCSYGGTPTSTELSRLQTAIIPDGRAISQKGNAELNAIFSGKAGQLIQAYDSGARTQLDFLRTDGSVVSYTIDRNSNSILNPVIKSETSQNSRTDIITSGF